MLKGYACKIKINGRHGQRQETGWNLREVACWYIKDGNGDRIIQEVKDLLLAGEYIEDYEEELSDGDYEEISDEDFVTALKHTHR